jgi:hypothetical protein
VIAGTLLTWLASATGMAVAVVLMFACGLALAYTQLKSRLTIDLRDTFVGPLAALTLTVIGYLALVRIIGSDHPLWVAVVWKVGWAFAGFSLFLLLVQPRAFIERSEYIWRLWRRQAPTTVNLEAKT